MSDFKKTDRTRVKRLSKRGVYDRSTIYEILDAGYVCHVGFVSGGQPIIIPMAYGRDEDVIYLHGSTRSRLQQVLSDEAECCISVTHLDGMVMSRSAFDHSMNYRSVVIFGKCRSLESVTEKRTAMKVVTEHLVPGRWDEVQQPRDEELEATSVIAVSIDEASAKIRSGPPQDSQKVLDLPVWAGVIPFERNAGDPVPDPILDDEIPVSPSVKNFTLK